MFMYLKGHLMVIQQKFGLQKVDGCIVANNNSKIPKEDLNNIMKTINLNFFYIVSKWEEVQGEDNIKFYC